MYKVVNLIADENVSNLQILKQRAMISSAYIKKIKWQHACIADFITAIPDFNFFFKLNSQKIISVVSDSCLHFLNFYSEKCFSLIYLF